MIYTVTFNPAIDYVVHLQGELKQEGINRNTAEEYQFGGKGINVSNVLRTLGVESEALGFVAGFTGEGLEKGLQASGLHTDFIHVAEGMTRINVKIKAEQEAEINGIGPNITQKDMKQLYQKLDQIQAGDTLVLSGSIPSCLASDTYEKIMAHLADKDIRIVVDATRDLLVNVLKYHPFLIKPNNHELGEIFNTVLKTDEEIANCARKLQEMGGRNILVSMAGDGALLLDETGKRLESLGVTMQVEEDAVRLLAKKGSHRDYGARPLRRAIAAWVEDPAADLLLSGQCQRGGGLHVLVQENRVRVECLTGGNSACDMI